VAGQPAGLALRSSSRSAKAEVEVIVSYRSSADSVAKAMQRVNICASEKPARHDQEGRPHVGYNKWNEGHRVAAILLAQLA